MIEEASGGEKMVSLRLALLACMTICMHGSLALAQQVFDVTQYGAKGDGGTENSKAFQKAWGAACEHEGPAKLLVPSGTFVLGPVTFAGPCFSDAPMLVEIRGTLKALPAVKSFPQDVWIEFKAVRDLDVSGGGIIDGQGGAADAWKKTGKIMATSMRLGGINNGTVSHLKFVDSKGVHIKVLRSAFVTVHNVVIQAPANSPNTDGIHLSGANHVNITNVDIGTGDDCISIGPGSIFVDINNVQCGPGHGISIGSLGKYPNERDVSFINVKNCTLTKTTNGVRIKTWPGSPPGVASHFMFEDITMDGAANPVIIDQEYCPAHNCANKPSMVRIHDVTFRRIKGTTTDTEAVILKCSSAEPCEEVHLEDIEIKSLTHATLTSTCSNVQGESTGVQIPGICI